MEDTFERDRGMPDDPELEQELETFKQYLEKILVEIEKMPPSKKEYTIRKLDKLLASKTSLERTNKLLEKLYKKISKK